MVLAAAPSIGRASAVEPPPTAPEADLTRDLYERYAGQIYGYCLHKLGSREEAEDAVQNTFLNAFRGLRRGVEPQAESAWLFKIAENVCLSRHRSSFRRGRVETPSDLQAIQDVTPSPEHRSDDLIGLEEALARMPESQRRAILLREWQGLSYREISEEMDLSQAAVETLIFRARRTLAQGLEDEPRTRRWKRVRQGADAGWAAAILKTLFTTGATVKAVASAVAVGSAVVAASTGGLATHHRHGLHPRPVTKAPAASLTAFPSVPSFAAPASTTAPASLDKVATVKRKPSPLKVPAGVVTSILAMPSDTATPTAPPTETPIPEPTPRATPAPAPDPPRQTDTPQPPAPPVTVIPVPTPTPTPPATTPTHGFQEGNGTVTSDPTQVPAPTPPPAKNIVPGPLDSVPTPVATTPVVVATPPRQADPVAQPKPIATPILTTLSSTSDNG